jgi:hypothetical protein
VPRMLSIKLALKKWSYPAPISEGAEYTYAFQRAELFGKPSAFRAFVRMGETTGG